MAGEASKLEGPSMTPIFVARTISDAAEDLCDKMHELSTTWPPASRGFTEISGNKCGAIVQDSVEQSELNEYRGIVETLKDRLWVDQALCDEIQQGPWGYQQGALQKDGHSKEKALDGFRAKYKEFLPNGKDTRLYLLKEVLSELQLEMGGENNQKPADMESYQEIKADLRKLIGDQKVREFLERSGTVTDGDVLSFYKHHLPKWADTLPTTLRRAGNAIQREVEDETERENRAKLSQQRRAAAVQRLRRYQAMIQQGFSSKEAMAQLAKEYQNQAFEKSLPMRGIQKLERLNGEAWSYVSSAPKYMEEYSDIEMKGDVMLVKTWDNMEKGVTVHVEHVDGAGTLGTGVSAKKELSMCCIQEVSSDEHNNNSDSISENEPDVESRGRAPGSPTKRRIVSGDRNPSPTKKGKVSPEKGQICRTRGIAISVKTQR
ncbi:hypothetical protein BDZ45DRAFT_695818 [Acephala macrosclerotiorum]|nr:hypothetical protein BDZ45DRAFT_695818 [Acephala macrosclerotiorum]